MFLCPLPSSILDLQLYFNEVIKVYNATKEHFSPLVLSTSGK